MNGSEFTGNETGPYENPEDNFHYYNHLNPAQQHIAWIHQWKIQHWEIHQACKDLGQDTPSDEYVKGFMDGLSMTPPKSTSLNTYEMEEGANNFVRKIMNSNQGK